MARVIWTEPALKDVQAITAFIAKDSPVYAKRFGHRLREAPKRLKLFPLIGWMVPEFERENLREILVGSYRIIYEVRGSDCHIVAVVHGSRNLPRLIQPTKEENDNG
jgi:addiction module RelE/StbE family toxin